jgi:hypothetical protein
MTGGGLQAAKNAVWEPASCRSQRVISSQWRSAALTEGDKAGGEVASTAANRQAAAGSLMLRP